MIHLDSNVLVALPDLTESNHRLIQRIKNGESVAASSLTWFEFCCGPVSEKHLHFVRTALGDQIVNLNETIAERAALLFNGCGRRRSLRTDCLIAATALIADAELATFNADDFGPFAVYGLKLLPL